MSWCNPRGGRVCPVGLPELSHALISPGDQLAAQFDQILNLSGMFGPLLPLDQALTFWAPLDYTLNDLRGALPTFTRASTAVWHRENGQYDLVPANTPRFEQGQLLMEARARNVFLNSAAPVTQSINLPIGLHTLSVIGAGTVTSSDDGGTATGHGFAMDGAPLTIDVTVAGNIRFTVADSPTFVQVESGPIATSPIITLAAPEDREDEILTYGDVLSFFNMPQGMSLVTIRPLFRFFEDSTGNHGILNTREIAIGVIYHDRTSMKTSDGVNARAISHDNSVSGDVFKVATRWTTAGDTDLQVGVQKNGGAWSWVGATTYDGAFDSNGLLHLLPLIAYPYRIGNVQIYNEDKGTSWIEQNY